MEIGERIKARRIELGLSQDELAKKLGYKSRSSINKVELGTQSLRQEKIAAIAAALETTPSYIMGWTDDPENAPEHDAVTESNAPPIRDEDIRAAFFNGADPTITDEEQAAMWDEVRDYINYKIQQRRKGNK